MARPETPTGLAAIMAASASGSAGALRGKRLIGLSVLVGFPLLIQLIVLIFSEGSGSSFNVFATIVDTAYLRVIVPLALIFLGTAALGDEWEGGTASYVVAAPIARGHIVVGRWITSAHRALLLIVPAMLVLFAMCMLPHAATFADYASVYLARLLWVIVAVSLVSLGYTAVFLFFGLALKRARVRARVRGADRQPAARLRHALDVLPRAQPHLAHDRARDLPAADLRHRRGGADHGGAVRADDRDLGRRRAGHVHLAAEAQGSDGVHAGRVERGLGASPGLRVGGGRPPALR
jgi:hypothetical protein